MRVQKKLDNARKKAAAIQAQKWRLKIRLFPPRPETSTESSSRANVFHSSSSQKCK